MGKRLIPCKVDDEYLHGAGQLAGAVGSHDDVYLRIYFGGMWSGLSRYVTFKDALGENVTKVWLLPSLMVDDMEDVYDVPIPQSAKAKQGNMMVTITGYGTNEDGTREINATNTVTAYFKILEADADIADDESITTTLAQQVVALLNAYTATEAARIEAESARATAEAERAMAEEARAEAELQRAEAELRRAEAARNRATAIVKNVQLTIPKDSWVKADPPEPDKDDYSYICDVTVEGITDDMYPDGAPLPGYFGIAARAGVLGGCDVCNGFIRFYAREIPEADIKCGINLLRMSSAATTQNAAEEQTGTDNSTGSATTYTHNQQTAAAVWNITHNLGRHPSVTTVDPDGNVVVGDVRYLSENALTVTFGKAFSGTAYLN